MAGIFDYIAWRGDLSFDKAPFNAVDNIILTHISYLPFDRIVPGPDEKECIGIAAAARKMAAIVKKTPTAFDDELVFQDDPALIAAMGASERYGKLQLCAYVNQIDIQEEKQFSAVTV
ncbi:MAG: DUF2974 domain-containing protein, partial [Treponema sp.]|nr:DUF2974 domain-containing protein [Treponema sp.]